MKRKLLGLLAVSTLAMTLPAIAEAAPGKVDRPVNLRSAPSASEGSVYRTLQPGTKLEVLDVSNTYWLKVKVADKTGYVSSSYVTVAKESTSSVGKKVASSSTVKSGTSANASSSSSVKPTTPPAIATVKPTPVASTSALTGSGVVTKNVNFRAEPITGSDVYRVLSAGEAFVAVELTNSAWLKITDSNGVSGYVSTGFVSYTLPGGSSSTDLPVVTPQPSAVAPSTPSPAPTTQAPASGNPISSAIADQVIEDALALQGITHYGFGKNDAPVLLDCSSFTRYVFGLQGISLPFGTAYQKDIGIAVEKDQWQKGDLLFFWDSVPGLIGHVGIYDGKGNLVHNSASKDGVAISPLNLKYWQDHYVSARRVLQ
ncbi:C40 family peptidase [Saccharibacillus sp. JS10]|uniref:C40 family peptidase n=1 Tax=Saccharibacillus sp. JS10 TaxID=2950552 RepID=UPI00210B72A2|nr:C40 family peptidase [Saccharibacillus sp. JS10]MCQ4088046.1 SH3 domain-containing protein [Saccharibacillus sp. JS10]